MASRRVGKSKDLSWTSVVSRCLALANMVWDRSSFEHWRGLWHDVFLHFAIAADLAWVLWEIQDEIAVEDRNNPRLLHVDMRILSFCSHNPSLYWFCQFLAKFVLSLLSSHVALKSRVVIDQVEINSVVVFWNGSKFC